MIKPEITVILPTLPNENLMPTMLSLQNQSFKNYELIVMVDMVGKQQSLLRNSGAKRALGKYLFFLEADIRLKNYALAMLYETMRATDYHTAFVYGEYLSHTTKETPIKVGQPFDILRLKENNYISTVSLVRKNEFLKVGGFDEKIQRFQDWDLWLTFVEKGYVGQFLPMVIFETGFRLSIVSNDKNIPYEQALEIIKKKHGL